MDRSPCSLPEGPARGGGVEGVRPERMWNRPGAQGLDSWTGKGTVGTSAPVSSPHRLQCLCHVPCGGSQEFFFVFGCGNSTQNFMGRGSNLCHSGDNTRSLNTRPPGNSPNLYFQSSPLPRTPALGVLITSSENLLHCLISILHLLGPRLNS